MSAEDVDEYLAQLDEPKRSTLVRLRRSIAAVIPGAEQGLSYGVPVFRLGGKPVAGFSAATHWLSYLPHSGEILASMTDDELEGLTASKGALRFPVDQAPSDSLVSRLIEARRVEAGV
jgi:uncharacterized protein YdhG (YjbR/CyaY superfamily)